MLEFVARELEGTPLLVVGTYRDVALRRGDRLVETLAELTREGSFERLPLRGLSDVEVASLVEAIMGRPAAPELVQAIHRQAEGNPLFVTEVVRLLGQEDTFADERRPGSRLERARARGSAGGHRQAPRPAFGGLQRRPPARVRHRPGVRPASVAGARR